MQDDDQIYNAMHSDKVTDGDTSMQNRHNPTVHGPLMKFFTAPPPFHPPSLLVFLKQLLNKQLLHKEG
jgi:hypothetical protein